MGGFEHTRIRQSLQSQSDRYRTFCCCQSRLNKTCPHAVPDHHAHSMRVKRTPVTVHKRSPQLSFRQTPTAVSVDSAKQLPQRIPIIRVPGRRRRRRGPLLLRNRRPTMVVLRRRSVAIVCWGRAAHRRAGVVARVVAVVVCTWWRAGLVACWAPAVALFWAVGVL